VSDTKFNRADYATEEWREMQAEVLAESGHVCQICGGLWGEATVAHHVYYDNGVLCKDALVALCRTCHDEIHSSSPYCQACGAFFWMETLDAHARYHTGWDYRRSDEMSGYCSDCAWPFLKDD